MSSEKITKLLDDLQLYHPDLYLLVSLIRKMIYDLDPSISEEVKYGGILFSQGENFCGIFSYSKHVSIEFSAGASLVDQYNQLQGKGKFRRHIKLNSVQDLQSKHIENYLSLALQEVRSR